MSNLLGGISGLPAGLPTTIPAQTAAPTVGQQVPGIQGLSAGSPATAGLLPPGTGVNGLLTGFPPEVLASLGAGSAVGVGAGNLLGVLPPGTAAGTAQRSLTQTFTDPFGPFPGMPSLSNPNPVGNIFTEGGKVTIQDPIGPFPGFATLSNPVVPNAPPGSLPAASALGTGLGTIPSAVGNGVPINSNLPGAGLAGSLPGGLAGLTGAGAGATGLPPQLAALLGGGAAAGATPTAGTGTGAAGLPPELLSLLAGQGGGATVDPRIAALTQTNIQGPGDVSGLPPGFPTSLFGLGTPPPFDNVAGLASSGQGVGAGLPPELAALLGGSAGAGTAPTAGTAGLPPELLSLLAGQGGGATVDPRIAALTQTNIQGPQDVSGLPPGFPSSLFGQGTPPPFDNVSGLAASGTGGAGGAAGAGELDPQVLAGLLQQGGGMNATQLQAILEKARSTSIPGGAVPPPSPTGKVSTSGAESLRNTPFTESDFNTILPTSFNATIPGLGAAGLGTTGLGATAAGIGSLGASTGLGTAGLGTTGFGSTGLGTATSPTGTLAGANPALGQSTISGTPGISLQSAFGQTPGLGQPAATGADPFAALSGVPAQNPAIQNPTAGLNPLGTAAGAGAQADPFGLGTSSQLSPQLQGQVTPDMPGQLAQMMSQFGMDPSTMGDMLKQVGADPALMQQFGLDPSMVSDMLSMMGGNSSASAMGSPMTGAGPSQMMPPFASPDMMSSPSSYPTDSMGSMKSPGGIMGVVSQMLEMMTTVIDMMMNMFEMFMDKSSGDKDSGRHDARHSFSHSSAQPSADSFGSTRWAGAEY